MKKLMGMILILIVMASVIAGCGESKDKASGSSGKEDKKVLKMATSADFPPFESRDPEGNFKGFDIELGQMIADELGYKLEIEDMQFDGLIGALQAKRVDMVMAGMSATKERKKNAEFSTEYHRSGESFLVEADSNINSIEDLKGKKVGVQLGTIQEEGAEKLAKEYDFEIKKVDKAGLLVQELNSNRIDVGYMDKTVADGYAKEQDLKVFADPTESSPGMGIAFPKGSDLVADVNKVLAKFEKDGILKELEDKWVNKK
ncbi:transporter substrate-binding domain-containing protein [Virgibacillus proomii]|jgi:arginine/lysine/histidine transporter system substrate-binding protein|uniref:transporter substrate-binding domain-containing protein n=1 Tax=Virgibacillus proomii TaxID=84407 RepID=UPI0009865650|nr:transporter substrate-binding domain-containing protein [Virgibacillus proomii]